MAEKNDYVNRELSWIEFNYRVLSEARDKSIPLFDRLKFLSITASNLDEFLHGPCSFFKGYGPCKICEKRYCRTDCKRAAGKDR